MASRKPRFNPNPPLPLMQPSAPKAAIALALLLTASGILLIALGTIYASNLPDSFAFLALGILCFVPGIYHVFIVFQCMRGVDGYSYRNLVD